MKDKKFESVKDNLQTVTDIYSKVKARIWPLFFLCVPSRFDSGLAAGRRRMGGVDRRGGRAGG